jgi:UDP-N-acetylmuramoyl-tripeptide--D-alanyl-D-alanine ligase
MKMPTIGWFSKTIGAPSPSLLSNLSLGPISIDTRTLTEGDTFWAIKSARDGHSFVSEAFSRGAKAAVVEKAWAETEAAASFQDRLIGVENTRDALRAAAEAWRMTFGFPVIGITGTNGKTSTKDLIVRVLSQKFDAHGTPGNFNNEIGVPLTLLGTSAGSDIALIEMGASHGGEIFDLCQICKPTHGLVTSIGRAHLAGFGNIEVVAQTKGALYDYVATSGVAFVPTDDDLCRAESALNRRKIGYGFNKQPLDWIAEFHRGESLTFDSDGCGHFQLEGTEITLSIPGRPAALSALAALTVAQSFGLLPHECTEAIRSWQGVPGRVVILHLGEITVMDDSYNANPMSMRAALETLSFLPAKRRVAILGDMNELGNDAETDHLALGRDVKLYGIGSAVFVGDFADVAATESRSQGTESIAFADFETLDKELPSLIKAGDAVLIKGSRSMRLERVMQKLKTLFA